MYLHSGCKQKQTYGREGEQLVPSNSPSCATINTLLWHLPSQVTPKSNRVPSCCSAAAPGVDCEAALTEIRQATMNTPVRTMVHKAVSQGLWYGHKTSDKNCQGITSVGISGFNYKTAHPASKPPFMPHHVSDTESHCCLF